VAGVAHGQDHVAAGPGAGHARGPGLVEPDRRGAHRHASAHGQRVARVDDQVREHLLDLVAVGADARRNRAQVGHQLDVLADHAPQHRGGFVITR
jgi:hypothetical protein